MEVQSVNITGVGASALNNYCNSSPQYLDYSIIENVYLIGDSLTINNNTANICNLYSDFTSISANLTPGNTYSLSVNLGTCHPLGFSFIDFANVYIDWNIDGDFDDINESVGLIALLKVLQVIILILQCLTMLYLEKVD